MIRLPIAGALGRIWLSHDYGSTVEHSILSVFSGPAVITRLASRSVITRYLLVAGAGHQPLRRRRHLHVRPEAELACGRRATRLHRRSCVMASPRPPRTSMSSVV